jgi:transposase
MNNSLVLTKKQKKELEDFKKNNCRGLREFNRAMILTFLSKGMAVNEVEELLDVDRTTVWRIKKRFEENGVEYALFDSDRPGQPKKYTTDQEAELVALACGPVPNGRRRWTIRLLVEELKKKKGFETITFKTVRDMLKKTNLSLG